MTARKQQILGGFFHKLCPISIGALALEMAASPERLKVLKERVQRMMQYRFSYDFATAITSFDDPRRRHEFNAGIMFIQNEFNIKVWDRIRRPPRSDINTLMTNFESSAIMKMEKQMVFSSKVNGMIDGRLSLLALKSKRKSLKNIMKEIAAAILSSCFNDSEIKKFTCYDKARNGNITIPAEFLDTHCDILGHEGVLNISGLDNSLKASSIHEALSSAVHNYCSNARNRKP